MSPRVSVCIATYNRRRYLQETLESIRAQTYGDYEIVIVDDGSSDGTEEMIRGLEYPVRYHWQENAGEPASRNKLIELAQGELITFIDSDDLLFPYSLEVLVEALEEHGYDKVAYSSYVGIDKKGDPIRRKRRRLPSGSIVADLFEYIYVHSCGTLCRKEFFHEAGGFDVSLRVCSPYVVWLKLALGHEFVSVSKPTFKRRRHSDNLSEPSYRNCMIELRALEDFYFNGGGRTHIEHRRAMKRLSKEGYRAARCALRERMAQEACRLLLQSLERYPNIKSGFWWVVAKAGR